MIKVKGNVEFYYNEQIKDLFKLSVDSQKKIYDRNGKGNEYLGWVDLANTYDKKEFEDIKVTAKSIRNNSEMVIVIGIGGSYLGAKATINALLGEYHNSFENKPKVYFAGCNLNSDNYKYYKEMIKKYDTSLVVISKSGTTLEPAIGFRILKDCMIEKYGSKFNERIYAITDKAKGALKEVANKFGYKTFVVPDDIGGRYSVFTAVGLLPMAIAGINIDKIYEGLNHATEIFKSSNIANNPCLRYAIYRYYTYKEGKKIEILLNYNQRLMYVAEWWKQLFAESEGKDGKGLFTASMNITSDLHSIGQLIQDGEKLFFETTLFDEESNSEVFIPFDDDNIDGLNYISNKDLQYVNKNAYLGTRKAHIDGGTPNIEICVPKIDEYYLAQIFYFFMMSCAISSYMLDVNPFNQPGVEKYKKNIYTLLKDK